MKTGDAIRFYRVQKSISQGDLAKLSGLSVSYLSLLENNKRCPNVSTLVKIADGLRVPMLALVFLADRENIAKINQRLAEMILHMAISFTKNQGADK